jgi:hypothetical protein
MKTLLIIFILLHGSIHTLGFLKAYKLMPVSQLNQPISRLNGALWVLTAVLFIGTGILFALGRQWWWMLSFAAIMISEYLIIKDWHDAKFGTFANVIILIMTIIGFIAWSLSRH